MGTTPFENIREDLGLLNGIVKGVMSM